MLFTDTCWALFQDPTLAINATSLTCITMTLVQLADDNTSSMSSEPFAKPSQTSTQTNKHRNKQTNKHTSNQTNEHTVVLLQPGLHSVLLNGVARLDGAIDLL